MQRKSSCPLYPQKRTCAVQLEMSAKGHKRTFVGATHPPLIVKKLSSNAEPYGGEDQETANDVVHGGALTQKQNGKYHD